MDKHVYLIIAHDDLCLSNLVKILDDSRNDIYIHIDKKTKCFNFDRISSLVKKSKLIFIDRVKVNWGGYSQIQCELNLLKAALQKDYKYYHLISGVDVPVKDMDYIHEFFKKYEGKEFIHFSRDIFNEATTTKERYKYFHLLRDYYGRDKNILNLLDKLFINMQKLLKINRINPNIKYCTGTNWFSITNDLARYVISQEKKIKNMYKHTKCCDEVFLQTLVYDSKYFSNVYNNEFTKNFGTCGRYIDWIRGRPYIFQEDDYNELISIADNYIFARKISKELIKKFADKAVGL